MTTPIKPTDRFQQLSGADQLDVRGIKLNRNAYAQNQVVLTITSEGKSITVRSTNVDVYEFLKGSDAHKAAAEIWLKEECLGIIKAVNVPNVKSISKTDNRIKIELKSGESNEHSFEKMSGLKVESLADESFIKLSSENIQKKIDESQSKLTQVSNSLGNTPMVRIISRSKLYVEKKSIESTISQLRSEIAKLQTQHTTAKVALISRETVTAKTPIDKITPEKDKKNVSDYFLGLSADHLKKLDLSHLTESQIKTIPFGHLLFDSKLIEAIPWTTLFNTPEKIQAIPLRSFIAQSNGPSQDELGLRLAKLIKQGGIDLNGLPWDTLNESQKSRLLSSLVMAQIKELLSKPEDLEQFSQIIFDINTKPLFAALKNDLNKQIKEYIKSVDPSSINAGIINNFITAKDSIFQFIFEVFNYKVDQINPLTGKNFTEKDIKNICRDMFIWTEFLPEEAFNALKTRLYELVETLTSEKSEYKLYLDALNYADEQGQRDLKLVSFLPGASPKSFDTDFGRSSYVMRTPQVFTSTGVGVTPYVISSTPSAFTNSIEGYKEYFEGLFPGKPEIRDDILKLLCQSPLNKVSTIKSIFSPTQGSYIAGSRHQQHYIVQDGDTLTFGYYMVTPSEEFMSHYMGHAVAHYTEYVLDLTKVGSSNRLVDLLKSTREKLVEIPFDELHGLKPEQMANLDQSQKDKLKDAMMSTSSPNFENYRLKIILGADDLQCRGLLLDNMAQQYITDFTKLDLTPFPQTKVLLERMKNILDNPHYDDNSVKKIVSFLQTFIDFSKARNYSKTAIAIHDFLTHLETHEADRKALHDLIKA